MPLLPLKSTASLWNERASAARKELLPYYRDLVRSGFPGIITLITMGLLVQYIRFLRDVPADFPTAVILMLLLTLATASAKMRTHVRAADIVFLLPGESRLGDYFRRAAVAALPGQILLQLAVLTVLWPIYIRTPADIQQPYAVVLLFLLLLKGWGLYCHWHELKLREQRTRAGLILVRWGITAVGIYAVLTVELWQAAGLMLLAGAAYTIGLQRLPARFQIHWERLIEQEQRSKQRLLLFFSWFTDVPLPEQRVKARKLTIKLVDRLSLGTSDIFRYLYTRTLIRSELSAIALRLTLVGVIMLSIAYGPWGVSAVYLLFFVAIRFQLKGLAGYHKQALWLQLYPQSTKVRLSGVQYIALRVHAVLACLLYIPVPFRGVPIVPAIVLAGGAGLLLVLFYRKPMKE